MTRILFVLGMVTFTSSVGFSAEETPAPEMDMAARRESVANLETRIAQREERLAEWGKDIVELDARIEKRVDELVKMLAGLRDSQESRTKVTQLKQEAIEGLKRGIDIYVSKRKEVRELVRKGDKEALGDLGKFDQRIIKRVDQIAELTKSIPTHQDVDKYEYDGGGSYWRGYYHESSRISEEWKQNRRDTVQSDKLREETSKALRESLERLDQRRRSLNDLLANRDLTDAARALYTTELGQIDAYQDHLKTQLTEVTIAHGGATQEVGRDQANDIEEMIQDARRDLREDVARLFRSYDQFVRGRAYLEKLKADLDARKQWLNEHDSPATGDP